MSPIVIQILTSPSAGEPMVKNDVIAAEKGIGLVGDRYHMGEGKYSGDPVWDANVTLIEQEAIDRANESDETQVSTDCLRRNLVTQGVQLSELLGKKFRIGTAVFQGTKPWPPCSYIEQMHGSALNLRKRFAKSGGIGASVVESGRFSVGDKIEILN